MHSNEFLPIALISANNNVSASKIISALIQDEATSNGHDLNGEDRVWHLANKYYRADVRMQPLVDGEPPPTHLSDLVEAHIIYLSADENEECAEQRLIQVGDIGRASHVRLVVSEGPERPAQAAWASRRRYELVPLQPPDLSDSDDENELDVQGLPRARAALHAHTWRGLVRLDRPNAPPPVTEDTLESEGSSCESGSWGSWQGERADAFASMLGSLHSEREALGALADDERRRRAEALLAAFSVALASPAPPAPRD